MTKEAYERITQISIAIENHNADKRKIKRILGDIPFEIEKAEVIHFINKYYKWFTLSH